MISSPEASSDNTLLLSYIIHFLLHDPEQLMQLLHSYQSASEEALSTTEIIRNQFYTEALQLNHPYVIDNIHSIISHNCYSFILILMTSNYHFFAFEQTPDCRKLHSVV